MLVDSNHCTSVHLNHTLHNLFTAIPTGKFTLIFEFEDTIGTVYQILKMYSNMCACDSMCKLTGQSLFKLEEHVISKDNLVCVLHYSTAALYCNCLSAEYQTNPKYMINLTP